MKFGSVPVRESPGKILAHSLFDAAGHKAFSKGHVITESDVEKLIRLGLEQVVVVTLESTDLNENDAARRIGEAVAGDGIRVVAPGVGRANLMADVTGPLRVNVSTLEHLNNIDEGITIATLREHTLVHKGDLVALVKVIPFGMQSARVVDVEATAHEAGAVLTVRPLAARSVALILSGPASTREQMIQSFGKAVRTRIEKLGSTLDALEYVDHTSAAIAAGIQAHRQHDLLIVASISAIVDREDMVPAALKMIGGSVAHFGVPVDPGSLLMLGYIDHTPVIGAPGCIKSPKTSVVDWILPRLLAGERLTRADLVAMGHGGLLADIEDRPMPR